MASSSSETTHSVDWLTNAIAKLEEENERYNTAIKANKEQIAIYKKELQASDITVFLRKLSGDCVSIITKSQKTIKQWKVQDINPAIDKTETDYELVLDGTILKNNKRVFGCGIGQHTTVDLVLRNFGGAEDDEPQPVAEPVKPQVAVQPVAVELSDDSEADDSGSDGSELIWQTTRKQERYEGTALYDPNADPSDPNLNKLVLEIPTVESSYDVFFFYKPNALAIQLYRAIENMTGLDKTAFRIMFQGQASQLAFYDNLDNYNLPDQSVKFKLEPKLRGGVLTRHLKKDDAVAKLKSRVISKVNGLVKKEEVEMDTEDTTLASPLVLSSLVEFEEKMGKLKVLRAEGLPVIKLGLSKLSLAQLNEIEKISKGGTRNGISEEKLYKMIDYMYPDLQTLDHSVCAIRIAKKNAIVSLMALFAEEYANYNPASGTATLDIPQLRKDVEFVKVSRVPTNVGEATANSCVVA